MWLREFISKIYDKEILNVLALYFVNAYNSCVQDSSKAMNHDFGSLPGLSTSTFVTSTSTYGLSGEDFMPVFTQLLKQSDPNDPQWTRFRAELAFVKGDYGAAARFYLTTLTSVTAYFTKPVACGLEGTEWQDKVLANLIKCLTESGQHTAAAAVCQCKSEPDYPTAFKCLEERNDCGDAMDAFYEDLWDVTILEYAVNMHTKKGELARRRQALEKISSLQVNTNNSVDILSQVALNKKGHFMRSLCKLFFV